MLHDELRRRSLVVSRLATSTSVVRKPILHPGTVTTTKPARVGERIELRRELARDGAGLESCFHTAEDTQLVRNNVFEVIDGRDDSRSYDLIESKIRTEYDFFQYGSKHYY